MEKIDSEAALEAKLNKSIEVIFPNIDKKRFQHQKSFTIKLGRKVITTDLKTQIKEFHHFPRLDVLIEFDGEPFIIFELKREDQKLTTDDRDQGISYARLHDKMPPLVIVSNGQDTEFYETYTKNKWNAIDKDEKSLKELINYTASLALKDKQDAVLNLLGVNFSMWINIFNKNSSTFFDNLTGPIQDYLFPLTNDLQIELPEVKKTIESVELNESVALVGRPMSGKTNILKSVFDHYKTDDNILFIFVDLQYFRGGILQLIANIFMEELGFKVPIDEVRSWIINTLGFLRDKKVILMIDNFTIAEKGFANELLELLSLQLNSGNNFSIILTTTENNFNNLTLNKGSKSNNLFSSHLKKIEVEDNLDFNTLKDVFNQGFQGRFNLGAEYNEEYRNVRFSRYIAATLLKMEELNDEAPYRIPSLFDFRLLTNTWNDFSSNLELLDNICLIANAIIVNREKFCIRDMKYYYPIQIFREIENSLIQKLMDYGYINKSVNHMDIYLEFTIKDLLATCAVSEIKYLIGPLLYKDDVSEFVETLLDYSFLFPYPDFVAASAIRSMENSYNNEKLVQIINYLKLKQPTENADVLDKSYLPWATIVQLLCDKKHFQELGMLDFYYKLIYYFASNNKLIFRHMHYFKKVNAFPINEDLVISIKEGQVEPIVNVLNYELIVNPEKMLEITKTAVQNELYGLQWRIHLALPEENYNDIQMEIKGLVDALVNEVNRQLPK